LVSQDVVLFNDTIAANIAYGTPTRERRARNRSASAAGAAHALEFIDVAARRHSTR
jgi:subfamily B ATP-binding cassette protein MsbA